MLACLHAKEQSHRAVSMFVDSDRIYFFLFPGIRRIWNGLFLQLTCWTPCNLNPIWSTVLVDLTGWASWPSNPYFFNPYLFWFWQHHAALEYTDYYYWITLILRNTFKSCKVNSPAGSEVSVLLHRVCECVWIYFVEYPFLTPSCNFQMPSGTIN